MDWSNLKSLEIINLILQELKENFNLAIKQFEWISKSTTTIQRIFDKVIFILLSRTWIQRYLN